MKKETDIVKWLSDHPLISLNALEKECSIPQSTLSKSLKGTMGFPEKHRAAIMAALKKYGLK